MSSGCSSGAKSIGAYARMMSISGAKDTGSYKKTITGGFLPLATSIEYEGLFNELYFDIGQEKEKIFAPKYSYCKSEDPLSHTSEHYLSIGLASKYDGDGLKKIGRNPFNLIIAIDISGSMAASFMSVEDKRSKIEVTVNAVFSIISLLSPNDRFGCVSFNDDISVVQELEMMEKINIPELKNKILELKPNGGTALSAALKKSTRIFDEVKKDEKKYRERENCIMVLTDLVPSAKDVSTSTFINTVSKNSTERIFSTFIGIGAEFSSDLMKKLGKIRGCNYYTVYTAADFKKIIEVDFVYILSPVAFNISLSIRSDQFVVERVYGSPGNEIPSSSGEMLKIDCVSPSAVDENNKTKGGIILAKLNSTSSSPSASILTCRLQYEDRDGEIHVDEQQVNVPFVDGPNFYNGEAARKSILLTRFVNISKHWIMDETRRKIALESEDIGQSNNNNNNESFKHTISFTTVKGITPPPLVQSKKKNKRFDFYVDSHYKSLVQSFLDHYKSETSEIGDPLLEPYILNLQKMTQFKQSDCKDAEEAVNKTHLDCIQYFIESGDTIEISAAVAPKILLAIANEGNISLLNNLYQQFTKYEQSLPAIEAAASKGHPITLHSLLELFKKTTPITAQNILAPLKAATQEGNVECITELLSHVPDFDMKVNSSDLLKIAYNYGKSECAKFLLDKGAKADGITLEEIQADLNPSKTKLNELDLVFCCDCTGSMGSYLQSAQQSIITIADNISTQGECDVRFGLVKYRDHPPQDNSYVTQTHNFTRSTKRMQAYVNTMHASGGGDAPECLVDGMEMCLNMEYRPNATKIVCIISDAPPHGLNNSGDGFPAGCPCGLDPLEVARAMSENGIVIYSLGVDPTMELKDFLIAIARITEGQYAPLYSASFLSNVIVGGSIEEIELNRLSSKVKSEWESIKALGLDLDDSLLQLYENLQKKKVMVKQMSLPEDIKDNTNINILIGANNLEAARKQLQYKAQKKDNGKTQQYTLEEKLISLKQVTRLWNRLNIVK